MFEELSLFDGWGMNHYAVFGIFSLFIVWFTWFIKIPSAMGDTVGMSLTQQIAITLIVPVAIYWFISRRV